MWDPRKKKPLPRYAVLSDDALACSERTTQLGAYNLIPSELFWQARHRHLEEYGYLLRPRYKPGWKPSWIGTNLDPDFCEDSIMSIVGTICSTPMLIALGR